MSSERAVRLLREHIADSRGGNSESNVVVVDKHVVFLPSGEVVDASLQVVAGETKSTVSIELLARFAHYPVSVTGWVSLAKVCRLKKLVNITSAGRKQTAAFLLNSTSFVDYPESFLPTVTPEQEAAAHKAVSAKTGSSTAIKPKGGLSSSGLSQARILEVRAKLGASSGGRASSSSSGSLPQPEASGKEPVSKRGGETQGEYTLVNSSTQLHASKNLIDAVDFMDAVMGRDFRVTTYLEDARKKERAKAKGSSSSRDAIRGSTGTGEGDDESMAVHSVLGSMSSMGGTSDATERSRKAAETENEKRRFERKRKAPKPNAIPIILVPETLSSVLNLYNVKAFLEKGEYVRPNVDGEKPECPVMISHNSGVRTTTSDGRKRAPVKYEVHDDVEDFTREQWGRVVAVLTDGEEWQFDDFPWPGLVDMFQSIKGFHVHRTDKKMPGVISSWLVDTLNLDHNNRHRDAAVAGVFWTRLEEKLKNSKTKMRV